MFWGIKVVPCEEYLLVQPDVLGALPIIQATIGIDPSKERSIVQRTVGAEDPIFSCSLSRSGGRLSTESFGSSSSSTYDGQKVWYGRNPSLCHNESDTMDQVLLTTNADGPRFVKARVRAVWNGIQVPY